MMESVEDIPAASILDGLAVGLGDLRRVPRVRSTACRRASTSAAWSATARCATTPWASAASTRASCRHRRRARRHDRRSSTRPSTAGALGFSSSRTLRHRVPDGRYVPGTWADDRGAPRARRRARTPRPRRLRGSAAVRRRRPRRAAACDSELAWMEAVSIAIGPAVHLQPHQHRPTRASTAVTRSPSFVPRTPTARSIRPQTTTEVHRRAAPASRTARRSTTVPSWLALAPLSLADRLAALRDPGRRAELDRRGRGRPSAGSTRSSCSTATTAWPTTTATPTIA